MKPVFSCQDGVLIIKDANDDRELWRGKPDGYDVGKVLAVSDPDRCVAFLEPRLMKRPFPNLVCVDANGSVVWRAELPDHSGDDIYVDAEVRSGFLVAFSWLCYRVTIDPFSGEITSRLFTK